MDRRVQLNWKLRRIAAGLRQQDLSVILGMSASRYSAIERGDLLPTNDEYRDVEQLLPPLPATVLQNLDSKERLIETQASERRWPVGDGTKLTPLIQKAMSLVPRVIPRLKIAWIVRRRSDLRHRP
jgi:transcriptional regulator with XRE-family HTH domain